jgi:hypothetical protein
MLIAASVFLIAASEIAASEMNGMVIVYCW